MPKPKVFRAVKCPIREKAVPGIRAARCKRTDGRRHACLMTQYAELAGCPIWQKEAKVRHQTA